MSTPPDQKRIGMVCYFDPDTYPGVFQSANILAERGWHVDVVGLDLYGFGAKTFHPDVRVHRLRGGDASASGLSRLLRFARLTRSVAKAECWAYVVGHDMFGYVAARAASGLPTERCVFWSQDLQAVDRLPRSKKLLHRLKRRWLRTAPLLIAASEMRASAIQKYLAPGSNPHVVYNAPRRDLPKPSGVDWRRKLSVTETDVLVVYGGGFGRDRYVPELVASVADWPDNASLAIAGYGRTDVQAEIEALAKAPSRAGRVHLLGHLPSILDLARAADIGVSLFDQAPGHINLTHRGLASNKIFEYLACGCAVVCTSNREADALMQAWNCGTTLGQHQAQDIADAIRSLASNREGLSAMQKRAQEAHQSEFFFEKRFDAVREWLDSSPRMSAP